MCECMSVSIGGYLHIQIEKGVKTKREARDQAVSPVWT